MPTAEDQRESAMKELRLYAQPDVPPVIGSDALDTILDSNAKAAIWEASTEYEYGDVVLPTARNGHRYRCIAAGTSAATEPSWSALAGASVGDGEDDPQLLWMEDGPDFANIYNVRAAIHAAWMQKAAQASVLVGEAQVYEHCVKMAEKFLSVEVA